MAGTIGLIPAVVAAENDIHSSYGERSNKIVKNVMGIIDETVRMPRRKVLEAGMKNSPAVADDERIEGLRRPFDGQVKIGKQGGIDQAFAVMIGDWPGQQHRDIEQRRLWRDDQRVICAHRTVTDAMLTRLRHQCCRLPRVVRIQVDLPGGVQCLSQQPLESRLVDTAVDNREGDSASVESVVLQGLKIEVPPDIRGVAHRLAGAAGRRTRLYVLPQTADERIGVNRILFSFLNEKFRHAIPASSYSSAYQECFRVCRVQKCLQVFTISVSRTLSDRNCSK